MSAAVSTPHSHHHHADAAPRNTFTHLTYSRHHLIDIAMETIKIAENGQYTNSQGQTVHLKDDLDYAVENCVHYEHEFDFHAALKIHDMKSLKASLPRLCERNRRDSYSDAHIVDELRSPSTLKMSFGNGSGGKGGAGTGGSQRFPRTSFLVVSASWLESASELLGACPLTEQVRVGVLNSASGTTPGGRFLKGTLSQEDCLCRASLLYSCVSQPKFQSDGRFYGKNRSLRYGSSNCLIFSPDVPVIREDNVEGRLLDSYEKVSFVTLPAPNAFSTSINTGKEYNDIESDERQKELNRKNRNISVNDFTQLSPSSDDSSTDFDEKFEQKRRALLASLTDRIHRALSAFVLGNCTDLVLPAFGCGVHGNDPSMVASVFREMLTDPNQFGGRFRTVVFAIPPSRKQNYQAFAAYFQKKRVTCPPSFVRGTSLV